MNELLLGLSVILTYGGVVFAYAYFGKKGLFAFMIFANIVANIEVMILIRAFGIDQTLGNVLFASTFLITDALSEVYGKKTAQEAVKLGVFGSVLFLIFSQLWLCYEMQDSNTATYFSNIFAQTPRIVIVSLLVFVIASYLDVWLYHRWWAWSERICGDRQKWLWLRNNGSTLLSQLLNIVLFSFGAFYGVYSLEVIWQIILSGYMIFVVTSLLDTPALYLLVYLSKRKKEVL